MLLPLNQNQKIKIKNIVFEGNESFPDWRLRWQLKETKEQRWYLFWRSTFDDSKFECLEQIYRICHQCFRLHCIA